MSDIKTHQTGALAHQKGCCWFNNILTCNCPIINGPFGKYLHKGPFSNEELVNLLIRAANDNNEFDNRSDLEYYRLQGLNRMKKQKDK